MNRLTLTFLATLTMILVPTGAPTAQPAVAQDRGPGRAAAFPEACAGGLVPDDGSAETGYGWVPSVVDGIYVQAVDSRDLPSLALETVCVCWLKTRPDEEVDFEVVFYADDGGRPRAEPYASVPARATGVPQGITGRFYEVDVSGIALASGVNYVGVRWNPSADSFIFVCTDTSPATTPAEAFFIDDRARDWTSVFEAADPIFSAHRSIMIRVRSRARSVLDVPAISGTGRVVFVLGLAAAGLMATTSRRKRGR